MRLILGVMLSLAASAALAPGAPQARIARCPSGEDVRVLASGSKIKVVNVADDEIWGCVRATGRARVLKLIDFDDTVTAQVRGRHAALVEPVCSRYDGTCKATIIEIWDVAGGKRSLRRAYGDGGDDVYASVDALALGSDGGAVAVLGVGANRELWRLCAGRDRRRVASPDLAPRLERSGRRVWSYSAATGGRLEPVPDRCRVKKR